MRGGQCEATGNGAASARHGLKGQMAAGLSLFSIESKDKDLKANLLTSSQVEQGKQTYQTVFTPYK